jgi:hypothetical protein
VELGLCLGLGLVALLLGLGKVLVAAEAGAEELLLFLLAHLADLGEVHGVVRQRAVLHVPVPERRYRHLAVGTRRVLTRCCTHQRMQAVRIEKNEFTDVWITTGIQGLISSRSKKRFVHGTADAAIQGDGNHSYLSCVLHG